MRSERGCPWDRKQSLEDAVGYLIDECYELQGAVIDGSDRHIDEEFADVLFILLFAMGIYAERRPTSVGHAATAALHKLKRRHAHLLSGKVQSVEQQKESWDEIKKQEKSAPEGHFRIPDGHLPPVKRSVAIQKQAASLSFDWENPEGILHKIKEECDELLAELERGANGRIDEEIGDLFFSVVNLSRFLDLDPEVCLEGTNQKFIARMILVEKRLEMDGLSWQDTGLEILERYWQDSKKSRP